MSIFYLLHLSILAAVKLLNQILNVIQCHKQEFAIFWTNQKIRKYWVANRHNASRGIQYSSYRSEGRQYHMANKWITLSPDIYTSQGGCSPNCAICYHSLSVYNYTTVRASVHLYTAFYLCLIIKIGLSNNFFNKGIISPILLYPDNS